MMAAVISVSAAPMAAVTASGTVVGTRGVVVGLGRD